MPAPALASLAKKAGKSLKDAERYYNDAKKQAGPDDFKQIMGIVKKRLGLATKPVGVTESMIEMVLSGTNGKNLIEAVAGGDIEVRAFYDSGILHFCTIEDVLIEGGIDSRIDVMMDLSNDNTWPHDHPITELFEGYEGSLTALYSAFTKLLNMDGV